MSSRDCPQTTILKSGIFQREPKSGDVCWFCVEKRAVLVAGNFAADVWLLEDIHRLQQQRLLDAKVLSQLLDFVAAGKLIKDRIQIMERVPDLIY